MKIRVKDIRVGVRLRHNLGDVNGLADSMTRYGQLQPIVVTPELELLAGARRLAAAKALKWEEMDVVIIDLQWPEDRVAIEWVENEHRKSLSWSERVAAMRVMMPEVVEAALERKRAGRPAGDSSTGRALDTIAAELGTSRPTLAHAAEIVRAAEEHPDRYADLVRQMDDDGNVQRAWMELGKRAMQHADEVQPDDPVVLEDGLTLIGSWHQAGERLPSDSFALAVGIGLALSGNECAAISALAARVLKPGGDLVLLTAVDSLAWQIIALSEYLDYRWTIAMQHAERIERMEGRIGNVWSPILIFHKTGEISGYTGTDMWGNMDYVRWAGQAVQHWDAREQWVLDVTPGRFEDAVRAGVQNAEGLYVGCGPHMTREAE